EQCWKALQAGAMYDGIRYATAVYRNELARRVRAIGYRITPARHGFEIEGLSNAVLRHFSKRAQERDKMVRQMEEELGRKLSNNEVAYAVHRTRARKLKGISSAEVRERQQTQLSAGELQSLRALTASAQIGRPAPAEGCNRGSPQGGLRRGHTAKSAAVQAIGVHGHCDRAGRGWGGRH